MGISPQQPNRAQDHPWRAPAALHGLGFQEGLLHGVQLALRRQSLNRHDAFAGDGRDLGGARTRSYAVDQDGAGGALALAAAILGSGEIQIVTKDAEQCAVRIGIDPPPGAIDIQFGNPGHSFIVAQTGTDDERRSSVLSPYETFLAVISMGSSRPGN